MSVRATILLFALVSAVGPASLSGDEVRFGRDVLPILSDRCFHCHGPDESHREAGLRLDLRESVIGQPASGGVIVPHRPDESELWIRVTSADPDLRMPPVDSHRQPLEQREVDILRRWIASGAQWGKHWAFERPTRPNRPGIQSVDDFVRRRLDREGLRPASAAAKPTLIRRVSFDLTGLPPTLEQVDRFLADSSPSAYEQLVDRLLCSPHYGERMAVWWLDAARYADTDGYQQDATRTNWPWRDWVVDAFNQNMPFDQFTLEQFAGDLLADATPEQILATCFHRNHMTNGEGGRHPEESRVDYVIDRVNTTGTVWLGLTLGCAQCHSHKFDPLTQRDYYALSAFFNSINEDGRAGNQAAPYLKYRSMHAQRAIEEAQQVVDRRKVRAAAARTAAMGEFEAWLDQQLASVAGGFQAWHILKANALESTEGSTLSQGDDGVIQALGRNPKQDDYRIFASTGLRRVTGIRLEVFPHASHTSGKFSRGATGEFILTDVKLLVRRHGESQLRDIEIGGAVADVEKNVSGRAYGKVAGTLDDDPRNGWTTETHAARSRHVAVFALAEPLHIDESQELVFVMLHRSTLGDANIGRYRVSVTDQPGRAVRTLEPMPLEELADAPPESKADIAAPLRERLFEQFLADHDEYQQAKVEWARADAQLSQVQQAANELNVMVLEERKEPRLTHVLRRGVWDQKGEEVSAGLPPGIFPQATGEAATRLDLAKWLVSKDNPLTPRVVVNQLWQLCFGAGLVRTPEDFGVQGEFPTHPELLDWLALELVDSGWDIRHVLRLIVTSQTYRQSSRVSRELWERDPENRLLARGARYRLPSWMIRDAGLRASGLLHAVQGGPPVMPYQPDGVWAEMFMGRFRYQPSQGPAQFRRTLYAFWRRSAAPTFLFDSAQRRVCEVRPRRTNTPLQALSLLNDQTMMEASRELARRAVSGFPERPDRLDFIFRSILSRSADAYERSVMRREWRRAEKHYATSPADAERFLDFGQPEKRDAVKREAVVDVAAYTVVASMLFNLDEAITHE